MTQAFGGQGRSMLSWYEKGSRGTGNRKVFFGDSPTGKVVRKGQSFDDIYWRVYVKHQHGWTGGGPAKLSRATSIVSPNWSQAMIAHVWSSGEALTLDPATGVRGDRVVTSRYNDFANLRWLGNKPASQFKLHSTQESGRWVCVEARAKLNTPGQKDGLNQLWIDGRLEAERKNLDWRGELHRPRDQRRVPGDVLERRFAGHAVPLDRQLRHLDEADRPRRLPAESGIDQDAVSRTREDGLVAGRSGVCRSGRHRGLAIQSADRRRTGRRSMRATAVLSARWRTKSRLDAGHVYCFRVRQSSDTGQMSEWSPWHQAVRTADESANPARSG